MRISKADILLLSFILLTRIALFLWIHQDPSRLFNGDSAHYEGLALSLLTSGTYQYAPYEPYSDLIRPPGYPLLIAAVYALTYPGNYTALFVINLIGVLLLYFGIKQLLATVRLPVSPLIMAFFALDIGWLLYSKEIITEPIFTPLLVWSTIALLKAFKTHRLKYWILSGIGFSFATWIKPITLYLPVLLAPVLGLRLHKRYPVLIWLLLALLLPASWMVRNYLAHKSFVYTSIQNHNLLTGHAAFVYAQKFKLTHREAQEKIIREVQRENPRYPHLPFAQKNALEGKVAQRILSEHPLLYAQAILRGMLITLFDPGRLVWNRTFPIENPSKIGLTNIVGKAGIGGALRALLQKPLAQRIPLMLYLGFLLLLNGLALSGIPYLYRHAPQSFWLLSLIFLYLWILGGPNGYARFRLYLFPFLLVYAQAGLIQVKNWLQILHTRTSVPS